jgi:hypothetical protein
MEKDFISRLRHGADNIHSIGPVKAAELLREAAGVLEVLVPPKVIAGPWPAEAPNAATILRMRDALGQVIADAEAPLREILLVTLTPGEDGGFVVECPSIEGCISQGATREEALANIREAIEVGLDPFPTF